MIETARLRIEPLSLEELDMFVKNDFSFEHVKGLQKNRRSVPFDLLEILEEYIYPAVQKNSGNTEFSTLWVIIDKLNNQVVGDFCFKNLPDADGEVEIGYGTYERFRNKGIMSEAISGIIHWTRQFEYIQFLTATTLKSNRASIIVLKKNNFIKFDENSIQYFWKRKI